MNVSPAGAQAASTGPCVALIDAVDEVPPAAAVREPGHARGSGDTSIAVGLIAGLAVVAALYLARAFFIPLLLGILASYMLHPIVEWLKTHYIPRPVGAAAVLLLVVSVLSWLTVSMSDDAAAVIEKLPEAARQLRHQLSDARTSTPTALQNMQEAATELQGAATDAGARPGARAVPARGAPARTPDNSVWLHDYALAQSALLASVVAQTPIVLLLAFFLLSSGVHFRRKLVGFVGPSLSRKKDAVHILEEINTQVQRYLLAVLASNVLVGVCTWGAFVLLGMEQSGAWGISAGVLHFVPYLGPVCIAIASAMAAFLQSGSPLYALAVAGVSLVIAGVVGMGFMTWLQSRFARVNAAVLFIALLFFGWLWGLWGLLLGAPLIAIVKVVCDRVESLEPVGELLGK
jgi:predicted PurR-regulated permease PerM